jgi:AAA domain-containing protein
LNLSDLMTTGPIPRAQRITLYGPHGIGKSTLSAEFPDPIFIDTEDGTSHLSVNRIPAADYTSLTKALQAIRESDCRTVVLDTIDAVEVMLREEVCRKHHIDGMEGLGYGKAYTFLAEKFGTFITTYLDPLTAQGIHVVVVGHSNIKRVSFPGLDSFDRYELRLYLQCANRLKEWSDHVLFLNFKTRVVVEDGKPKGMGGKERAIYTQHDATHDAKTRVSIPEVTPCTFGAIGSLLCGWERPPQLSIQEQFANALGDIEEKRVIAFLIDRKQIADNQEISDVPAEYARAVLERITEFKQAIIEFDFLPF